MQNRRDRFGSRSLATFGLLLVIVQVYHPSVLLMLKEGQTAAWLLALLSGLFTALLIWPVAKILEQMPGKMLVDVATTGLGRWSGPVKGFLTMGLTVYLAGIILRETAEMTISAVFPHTPQTFVMVALLIGAFYIARGDAASLVRLGRIVVPFLLLSILLVIGGAIGWGEIHYLEPLLGPGLPRLLAAVPRSASLLATALITLVLAEQLESTRNLANWVAGVALAGGVIYAATLLTLLMLFPYPGCMDVAMPLHGAARLTLGGRFFERMEGIWVLAWVTSTILLLGALLYAGARALQRGFRMNRRRPLLPVMTSLVLSIALFPHDQADTVLLLQRSAIWIFLLAQMIPLLYTGVAAWRLRRQQS